MKITIGVVTFNGEDHIDTCIESAFSQSHPPTEIAIVDNASQDTTVDRIEALLLKATSLKIPLRHEINDSNRGFTSGANQILSRCVENPESAEIVVLVNQDAFLDENCLKELKKAFAGDKRLAVAGPKILYPDSKIIQYAGGYLEQPRCVGRHTGHHETDTGQFDLPQSTEFVTGAVMALRVSCLETTGCFDEVFSPGYYEDVDLCDRLRERDWTIQYIPGAVAWHHESSSFANRKYRLRLAQRNRLLYLLPRFSDIEFETRFRTEEFAAIANRLLPDELRALAEACLELISGLTFFLSARCQDPAGPIRQRVASCLRRIRHTAIDRLIGIED